MRMVVVADSKKRVGHSSVVVKLDALNRDIGDAAFLAMYAVVAVFESEDDLIAIGISRSVA